jgi:penicillin-binding protein 1A
LLILMVTGVTVASAAVITVGGAATMTLASLDEGLPDVQSFQDIDFNEQSIMYSRDGEQLAQFWDDRREVVDFQQIPAIVLDATTSTEDDTFWDNPGVDLQATINALLVEAGGGGDRGGGSTITQQLVRAVLLPKDVINNQFSSKEALYTRKAKEILQSYKLTQAFPGEDGKKEIITAYLNLIPYGGAVHGIAAAAEVYLGKDLKKLTIAEAALLAAIPQEPANLYPYADNRKGKYTNVVKEKVGKGKKAKTRLVIKADTELVQRQQFILRRLYEGKGRWTTLNEEQYQEALEQKIFIRPEKRVRYKAPQFVNLATTEVARILGNAYDPIQVGGYKITTTLDWKAQEIGQDLIWAGAVAPNLPVTEMYSGIKKRNLGAESGWITRLRSLGVRSGALVAMDYRTGDVLAYVGSPGYYRPSKSKKFEPQMDHLGIAKRQPGSAWKPIVYATGIETKRLTAGTILLDITTPFGGLNDEGSQWVPKNASSTDSGPIMVRDALQQSLNVPAIRALHRTGIKNVRKYAVRAGFQFLQEPYGFGDKALDVAGLAGAIGTVEVRPLDMAKVFGAFGNAGKVTEPRYILEIRGPDNEIVYKAGRPANKQVWSPQTAYIMADILKGNTNPAENQAWANIFALYNTKDGSRREAAVKTGTTNNLKDYSTYGFLPASKNKNLPALSVGVWYGNSDSSAPNVTNPPIYSLNNAGETWHAFVQRYMRNKPAPKFKRPKTGVISAAAQKPTGGTRTELYVRGTQPGGKNQVDSSSCGSSITSLENPGAPSSWLGAVSSWAGRGVGSSSQWGTTKTGSSGCYSGGARITTPSTSGGGGGSSSGSSSSGGGGSSSSGGGNKPAPTCQPGFTNKPKGCVIPG